MMVQKSLVSLKDLNFSAGFVTATTKKQSYRSKTAVELATCCELHILGAPRNLLKE